MSAQIIVGVSNIIKDTDQADHKAEFVNKTHELVCSLLQQESDKNCKAVIQANTYDVLTDARKVYIKQGHAINSTKLIAVIICCDRFMNSPVLQNAKKAYEAILQNKTVRVCCDYLIKEVAKTFVTDRFFDLCEIEAIDSVYDSLLIKGAAIRVLAHLQKESYGPELMNIWAKSFA